MYTFGASSDRGYDDPVIDTLQAARSFRKAGFTEAQAEAVLQMMRPAAEGDLVTKGDFRVESQAVRTEFQAVRTEIQSLRAGIYRQLWIMAAGIVGMTVALIKLLP